MVYEKEYFSDGSECRPALAGGVLPEAVMTAARAPVPPRPGPTPAEFRQALGQFPTGVTIVTAQGPDRPVGMTANSFSSVSLDPPLVLWSVAKAAPSYAAFVEAEAFAIHFLGAHHHELALRFARRGADKFADIPFAVGLTGAPVLDGVAPVIECRTWARYDGGDHMILVGEVLQLQAQTQDPLLFHSGVLRRIDGAARRQRPRALAHDGFARNYLAYLLSRASQTVSDEFHAALVNWRLSVAEWRVLACLSDGGGLGVGELAEMAIMKQPRMTKLLDRMEARGLVERRIDAADRRRAVIHLTEAGAAKAAPVLKAATEHEKRVLAPFTSEERAVIKHALDLLINHAGKAGD